MTTRGDPVLSARVLEAPEFLHHSMVINPGLYVL